KLSSVFKKLRSKGKLSESDVKTAMREIKLALLEADVNYKVVKSFISKVSERAIGSDVLESLTPAQQVIKIVNQELSSLMGSKENKINFPSRPPCVVMMCGLQGSGKTTHCAKIAKYYLKKGHRPLLVACDVYRPAAIEQLKIVGEQAGVSVFEMGAGDPVKIAKESIKHAKDYGNDLVLLDTAGRLHIDKDLMDELSNIKKTVNPNEILLVVDSMTGQDAVNVAEKFNETIGIDGVVLTKLDGDTRGGAALSVLEVTKKPIKFAGVGEKLDDLELFQPERMASRILGMGDMLTLIERAEENIKAKDAEKMAKKLKDNSFDMNDLLEQMNQIKKLGSIKDIIGMIPGAAKRVKSSDLENGETKIIKIQAIISSMTKKEREKPSIINPQRKRRIAAGSGTTVPDVNQLLRQFEQMQKMFKQMSARGKRRKKKLLPGLGDFNLL
ncbi:MAG: signal recognition particle protein, partial [Oscillospiraceae bacterium]|nr:signal recognition particle protein [Oscillospiraceae bacterium]